MEEKKRREGGTVYNFLFQHVYIVIYICVERGEERRKEERGEVEEGGVVSGG